MGRDSRARTSARAPSSPHPHTLAVPGPAMQLLNRAMIHPEQNSSETRSAEKSKRVLQLGENKHNPKNPPKMEERYFSLRTLSSYICGPNEMLLPD